jgi:hypothetical protein
VCALLRGTHNKSIKDALAITPRPITALDRLTSYAPDTGFDSKTPFVVTAGEQFLLLSPQGQPLFTLPRDADRRTYPETSVAMTGNHKLFFFHDQPRQHDNAHPTLPSFITEVTATGTVLRRYTLPPIPGPPASKSPLTASLYGLLVPPFFAAAANALGYSWHLSYSSDDIWDTMTQEHTFWLFACLCSLFGGVVSGTLAWLIGRRCVFTRGGQWAWTVGVFWLGLPGLLLMLSLRDWPAREPCPNCGRPRVVDRDRCEHCGAGFAAPMRDGTEIFEDAARQETIPMTTGI